MKMINYTNFKRINESLTREDIIKKLDGMILEDAKNYMKVIQGLDLKVAGQLASIGIRPKYNDKNVFVIDSIKKLIYLFSPTDDNNKRKLIIKDIIIDGLQKQKNDALNIANSFLTFEEVEEKLKKKLGRVPTESEVEREITRTGARYLPAGIYGVTTVDYNSEYASDTKDTEKANHFRIENWEGKELYQALHGYYKGDARVHMMKKALNIVKNPNNQSEIDKFIKELEKGGLRMNFSYGCINLTPRFVTYFREYGEDSYIFNMATDTNNYLVDNAKNYFDKQMKSKVCINPTSLGGELIQNTA